MATASLILLLVFISIHLPLLLSESFDHPTAKLTAELSTEWTLNKSLANNISYTDGSTIILPLLVSDKLGVSFAFGFFCHAPCSTFLLSIYFFYDRWEFLSSPPVVWSANPNHPVHLNANLLFSSDGDLILRDADGSFVWSTNTSGQGGETLNLLDSGNLVVLDSERRQLWASFDHPTDSWLLGQSLRHGQRLRADSSAILGCQFYVEIFDDGLNAFIDSDPPQLYYFARSSKHQNRSTYVTFSNGSIGNFTAFDLLGLPYHSYPLAFGSSFQYLKLEDDGHFRQYGWNNGMQLLGDAFLFQHDDCAYPTVCGC